MSLALLAIIGLALAFDFINGFHDAANSIATVVSTRVLSPRIAVLWAAFFNFVAFLVFQTRVAFDLPAISSAARVRHSESNSLERFISGNRTAKSAPPIVADLAGGISIGLRAFLLPEDGTSHKFCMSCSHPTERAT